MGEENLRIMSQAWKAVKRGGQKVAESFGKRNKKKEDMKERVEGKKPVQESETQSRPYGRPFKSSSAYEAGESSAAAAMRLGGGGGVDVDVDAAATNIKKKTMKKLVLHPLKKVGDFFLGKGKKERRQGQSHSSASASGGGSQSQSQGRQSQSCSAASQSQSPSSASASASHERAHVPPSGGHGLSLSSPTERKTTRRGIRHELKSYACNAT